MTTGLTNTLRNNFLRGMLSVKPEHRRSAQGSCLLLGVWVASPFSRGRAGPPQRLPPACKLQEQVHGRRGRGAQPPLRTPPAPAAASSVSEAQGFPSSDPSFCRTSRSSEPPGFGRPSCLRLFGSLAAPGFTSPPGHVAVMPASSRCWKNEKNKYT